MNFKTTIVLIVLLAVAAGALFFTREKAGEVPKTAEEKQRLFADAKPEDVTKLVVTPANGKRTALEKTGGEWRMTEPVNAPAEKFEVDNLVREIVELQSLGKVQTSGADATATGLSAPRYTIEFTAKDGKSHKLLVGEKSAVGDNLYVSTSGPADVQVVAGGLLENLEKPTSTYRDPKLVNVPTSDVKQVTISRGDSKIVLAKSGDDWKMTSPTSMPAEKSTVDDIVFGLTGLRAVEFVSEDPKEAGMYELSSPKLTATLSTASPSTQPAATTAPATQPVEIKFGRYDDVMKKNVFASGSQSPAIAKVSASILETLNKKPIELRDKRVVDVVAANASRIEITSDLQATTKPTSRPASKKTVVLARSKGPTLPVGIAAPTTAPTTAAAKPQAATAPSTTQASTQASTAPATKPSVASTKPATRWEIVEGEARMPADDSKVDQLLSQLHPLRVEKYLENPPATQPTASYTLNITTEGPGGTPVDKYEIKLVDPGNGQPLRGDYNGLAFEANRTLIDRLSGDFKKGAAGASGSPASESPGGSAFPDEQAP